MTIEIARDELIMDTLAIAALRRQLHGQVLTPDSPEYDTARRLLNLASRQFAPTTHG